MQKERAGKPRLPRTSALCALWRPAPARRMSSRLQRPLIADARAGGQLRIALVQSGQHFQHPPVRHATPRVAGASRAGWSGSATCGPLVKERETALSEGVQDISCGGVQDGSCGCAQTEGFSRQSC